MKKKRNLIVVTGGTGRFGVILKKKKFKNFIFPTKTKFNILDIKSLEKFLIKTKPKILIHLAGLSRPMVIHEKEIEKSIKLNIIGTCNLVIVCKKLNIKIIYFSTSYVYPGRKGNYLETDAVLPWNNYGWSKLGGESAVQMYNNSLIIRACMTERPFVHKSAFANVKSNFIYHEDFAKKFLKIINKKGIYNIGGKSQTIFNFAKKTNKNLKKIYSRGEFPLRQDMCLKKLLRAK